MSAPVSPSVPVTLSRARDLAPGYGAYGGSKRNAYRVALREMREAVAALDIARRLGFEVDVDEDRQSKIIGTLVKLANR